MPRAHTDAALRIFVDGRRFGFDEDEVVTFGRDPQSTVRLSNDVVSRWHIQLWRGPDGWELEDLGSANGTYVGDQRVHRYRIAVATDVWLGPPGRGVVVRIQPGAGGAPRRRRRGRPTSTMTTVKLLLLVAGVVTVGAGVFVLDWVTYDISGSGLAVPPQSQGLDFDAGKISLVASAVGGLVGVLGLQEALSRPVVGLILVAGAGVTAVATLYFMSDVKDLTFTVPGLTVTLDASLAAGGPVTLVGAALLALAGLLFALERE